jgi:hypothetical protein
MPLCPKVVQFAKTLSKPGGHGRATAISRQAFQQLLWKSGWTFRAPPQFAIARLIGKAEGVVGIDGESASLEVRGNVGQ